MRTPQISAEQQRLLRPEEVVGALELSSAAGWNQTAEDWEMLMELAPEGCLAMEADGRLVSTTTLLCYQRRLAWVGMVLTRAEYRGRGYARRLLASALEQADSLGVETVKLDATDQGRPLYESYGFQAEQAIERWWRPGTVELCMNSHQQSLNKHIVDCDAQAFGADRSGVLRELIQHSSFYVDSNAHLLARAGRMTNYLGPCVASDPLVARKILTGIINESPQASWSWDLLPQNRDAVELASNLGFSRQRSLTRMARGKPLHGRDDMVYAIAGFELG